MRARFLILVLLVPSIALAATFPDLPAEAVFHAPIQELHDAGILRGYDDGLFRPRGVVTRGEWAKIALASRDMDRGDASAITTIGSAMQRAVQEGLLLPGLSADEAMPRLDAIVLLGGAYGLTGAPGTSPFTDVPLIHAGVLGRLAELGVVRGVEPTRLGTTPLLRQEAAKLAWEAMRAFPDAQPVVTSTRLKLVMISQTSLSPGDSASIIFSLQDGSGNGIAGLTESDFHLQVVQGAVRKTGFSELGGGAYVYTIEAYAGGYPGPVRLRITSTGIETRETLEIPGAAQDDDQVAGQLAGVRVSDPYLQIGQTTTVVATLTDTGGNLLRGKRVSAQVVSGSGRMSAPMAESPANSGVYVGTYEAGNPGTAVIRVTLESFATMPSADVTVQVTY